MSEQIPPQIQNQLVRFQEQQEQYKALLLRKQQFEVEAREVEKALQECTNLPDDAIIYKSVGMLLFKSEKAKVIAELTEKKEELDLRIKTIEKQEQRLKQQLEELRKLIMEQVSLSGAGPASGS
ncbi:MAG: prefoldin subunit beta [Candidatus Methanomethylicaceae archaeon]|jgi:prefoldin beta subunit